MRARREQQVSKEAFIAHPSLILRSPPHSSFTQPSLNLNPPPASPFLPPPPSPHQHHRLSRPLSLSTLPLSHLLFIMAANAANDANMPNNNPALPNPNAAAAAPAAQQAAAPAAQRPPQDHVEFTVRASEDLFLVGTERTQLRVTKDTNYSCLMQKTQRFHSLFRHYAKYHGLRKGELEVRICVPPLALAQLLLVFALSPPALFTRVCGPLCSPMCVPPCSPRPPLCSPMCMAFVHPCVCPPQYSFLSYLGDDDTPESVQVSKSRAAWPRKRYTRAS